MNLSKSRRFMKRSLSMILIMAMIFTTAVPMNLVDAAAKVTVKKVTITNPATKVLVLKKGKSFTLKTNVKVTPNKSKNKKLTYKSSNASVVSVSSKGKIKACKTGVAKITVASKIKASKKAVLTVKVGTPVTKITLNKTSVTTAPEKPINLKVSYSSAKATYKKAIYKSSNTKVATVSDMGVITTVAKGTAVVTATAADGSNKTAKCSVKVLDYSEYNYDWKTATSIKNTYASNFKMGIGVGGNELTLGEASAFVRYHFDYVTMGNEMKPDAILDAPGCDANYAKGSNEVAINTANIDKYLTYARDHGLKVRYHNLLWHSQTPRWFFKADYNGDKLASKDVMEQRMKSFITQVVNYVESKYPGVVYAYDVVNEALHAPADEATQGTHWYEIYGDFSYVKHAFQYAKAAITANKSSAKLYYNDYNEYQNVDKIVNLIKTINTNDAGVYTKGLNCDGVGMQCHLSASYPTIEGKDTDGTLEYAINKFSEIGDVNVTELDIEATSNYNTIAKYNTTADYTKDKDGEIAAQGKRYKQVMKLFQNYSGKISSVTIWGISDGSPGWKPLKYPSMFSYNMGYLKPAFYGILQDARIQ